MNNMVEKGGISTINLDIAFTKKEKKDFKKKVTETREKLIAAQKENRRLLPFASGKTLLKPFD